METVQVKLKNVRQTPRKVGETAALIRRRSLDDALVILQHTPRRAAPTLVKLLKNAQQIAKTDRRLQVSSLAIEEISVTAGRTFRRYRLQAKFWGANKKGRGSRMIPWNRRTSHVFLSVSGQPVKKAEPKKAAAKSEEEADK